MSRATTLERDVQLTKDLLEDVYRILCNLDQYDPHVDIKTHIRSAQNMSDGIDKCIGMIEDKLL
jgi:hypothetical protein